MRHARGGAARSGGLIRVLAWTLVATTAWVLGPAPLLVSAAEEPSFAPRSVAPLAATEGERELDPVGGDASDRPLVGGRAEAEEAAREPSFDPETSELDEAATTATRAVYDNADGSRTAVVSPGPVRFQEDGEWTEIDLALTEEGGEIVPAASPAEVTFPTDAADGVAVHDSDAGPITVGVPSVVADPEEGAIDEGAARQPDQVVVEGDAGVESVITPLSTGFEHDVVYADRAHAAPAFTVDLQVPAGVVAVEDETGVALRAGDEVVAHYGGGVAFDASAGDDTPVVTELVGQDGGTVTVRVAVDSAWLAAPGRTFPVTIDPTYTSTIGTTPGGGDAYVNASAPTTSYAAAVDLRIGRDSSANVYRSFVRFGLGGIPSGAIIYGAELGLVNFQSTNCTPTQVRLRNLTSSFGSTTTWNTQPTAASIVSDTNLAKGATGCPGGWVSMDATSAVSNWYANPSNNFGLRLTADEATTAGYKRFYSSAFGSGMSPKLTVTYDRLAPEPTRAAPANGTRVLTTTPTLSVNPVTDPDGETVTYGFYVWAGDGLPLAGQITRSEPSTSTSWTVPAGTLADGVTYAWAAWARGGGGWFTQPTTSGTFTVDRRLGGGSAPTDSAGPVTVNLATGDAHVTAASPGVSTLGGPIEPSYSYHSSVRPPTGLTGAYYVDSNGNATIDETATMVRTDSTVEFDWTTTTPFDALPDEQYMVRWSGFVTVPATDTYYFGASGSNGFKVIVNGTTVLNRWPSSWAFTPVYGTGTALTAGQTVPITVEMIDTPGDGSYIELVYKTASALDVNVPSNWLTPARQTGGELSPGWELDLGGSAPVWETARATDDAITVQGADGSVLEFDRTPGGGYEALDGSDAVAALDAAGLVTVQQGGTTYVFGTDGTLTSATDGPVADSTSPLYTWTTTTTGGVTYRRVSTITDPVSNRDVDVTWRLPGATCPTAPSGFDTNPPTGALCEIDYWDGTSTSYFFKSGQLARVVDQGGTTTDYGYTNGVLTSVRNPLAHDAVARGVRADDATTLTQITYTSGKVTKVTEPAPTAGAQRPETTFSYGSGTTDVAVAGRTNGSGYTRRASYDGTGRMTTDIDVAGRTGTSVWNPLIDEQLWSTTDPEGLMRTMHYDAMGRVVDMFGPAPAAWYGTDRRPLTAYVAQVPHEEVELDGGVQGLATRWFPNRELAGEPVKTETSAGGTWGTSPTGGAAFSGRFSGLVAFGTPGTYGFGLTKNGKARLWIDGRLVVDGWATSGSASGSYGPTVATGEVHHIRVDYASPTSGTPSLGLTWTPPGGSSVTLPLASLSPGYEVMTSTSSPDGDQTVSYAGSGGNGAEDGVPATVTTDPGGTALEQTSTYEADGTGWQRLLSRTLPAGNTIAYGYYGGTETRDNPCTVATDPAVQGGREKTRTAPTAADGTTRVQEVVYDAAGRTVASRTGTGSWTCATYDARGRMVERAVPAFGGAPARTVTLDHAVGGSGAVLGDGDPLVATITDATGTITTEIDLLGRTVSTTDVWGTETVTAYDRSDRVTETETTAGGTTWAVGSNYDSTSRLSEVELDGATVAVPSYDGSDRLIGVDYPSTGGGAGNGTSLASMTYDTQGRVASVTWEDASGGLLASHAVTRDQAGRVTDEQIDGVDATPSGSSFTYDGASRLTQAVLADRNPTTGVPTGTTTTLGYGYAATGGCGALATAGDNANRTSLTVNGSTVASYCYDDADRLTSTTQSGYTGTIAYDAHGNTSTLAGETRAYDGDDRHVSTTAGGTTVTYVRDALDRIIERKVGGTTVARYSYVDGGDGAAVTLDGSGTLVQRSVALPGGATMAIGTSGTTWLHGNVKGDVLATSSSAGAKVGPTRTYEPNGRALTALADTGPGSLDSGWLGMFRRPLEHQAGLIETVEMGARQYDPVLGRFLEADPLDGGSCNDYEYTCGDPVGGLDLDGQANWTTPYIRCGLLCRARLLGQNCNRWYGNCGHFRLAMGFHMSMAFAWCELATWGGCKHIAVWSAITAMSAIAGSFFAPPWGTIVGALVGLAISVLSSAHQSRFTVGIRNAAWTVVRHAPPGWRHRCMWFYVSVRSKTGYFYTYPCEVN